MATIKDVSQLANVSISTVSRVINNTAQVAPEKREAVLAAMKELNFRPNSFAQALVSKRSNCIGVLVGDLCGGPFFAQMMRGIETMVDQANKFTIVMSGNHDIARERHAACMDGHFFDSIRATVYRNILTRFVRPFAAV